MVKIAIAGGTGQVSREIIDALLAAKKHQITILSRGRRPEGAGISPEISWRTVDYDDPVSLTEALRGVDTVLSFIQILSDPDQKSQKNLIDAAIAAKVTRFAPSEYGSKGIVNMPWWQGKGIVRQYLKEVNAKEKVLEYTLFQPGLFLDYLAYPHKTARHVDPLQTVFDFEHKRAILVEGHEDTVMTLTTVADLAAMVALAVECEAPWPEEGGIRGNRCTFAELIEIGRRVRGSFDVERVQIQDLENGDLNTSWGLEAVHRAVPDNQAADLLKAVSIGILLSSTKGAWDISDAWTGLIPDFKFTPVKDFLTQVWEGKP